MEMETGDEGGIPPRICKLGVCCPIAACLGILLLCSIRTVPPAHAGVVTTFGAVSSETLTPGIHLANPLCNVIPINLKTQLLYSDNQVPTQEGLSVELDVSLLYHVEPEQVRDLFLSLRPSSQDLRVVELRPLHLLEAPKVRVVGPIKSTRHVV